MPKRRERPGRTGEGARQLAAILSADAVGYSRLMGEDERAAVAAIRRHREALASEVAAHRGRVVDAVGDNLLALFPSAVDAVSCAVAARDRIEAAGDGVGPDRRLRFRIGVHLGDVRVEGGEVFGDAVNVAARLEAAADPGGVCISQAVRDQLHGRLALELDDLGELRLHNIAAPVRGYRVRASREGEQPGPPPPRTDARTGERHSVAVLPFANLSGEAEQDALADGLTEDLITLLAGTPGVLVIARTSTTAYQGRSVDVRRIGHELGALYVVEGSIRRLGERVRVTVQLVDARSGAHLWAERYDRSVQELFDLEDELVAGIAAQLQPQLLRAEARRAARTPPESLDAWALYHQALDALYMRGETPEQRAEGERLLDRALALDPAFPPARAMRAALAAMRARVSPGEDADAALRAAQAEGRRAVDQSPDDPMVLHHWATLQREVEGPDVSIPILERALALGWNDPQGWASLGLHLARAGRRPEAIEHVERAIRRSPKDPRRWAWEQFLSNVHLQEGNWERALDHAERATALNDRFPVGWFVRAAILARADRLDEARRCVARLRERAPGLTLASAEAVWRAAMTADEELRKEVFAWIRRAGFA